MLNIANKSMCGLIVTWLLLGVETSHAGEKFRVCADPLHPPYSTEAQTGYENKIAKLFADELGLELEYTWFPERIGFIRNTLKAEIDDKPGEYKCDVVMGLPTGSEMAATTRPYFRSSYVLLIAKGRGWDQVQSARQLAELSSEKLSKLKIAMFDRGPGTDWLEKNGLLEQGVPYQSMTGDDENNIAMQIEKDLRGGKIDMVILWGPMAGYVVSKQGKQHYSVIPMESAPGLRFDFSISMGVRQGDSIRKARLDSLIEANQDKIQAILSEYHFPLLPISQTKPAKDDD